jgi:Ca2+-binding EF-hand superfamily protein
MNVKRKNLIANFEARSVMLIAGWTLGAASAVMAQNMPARPAAISDSEISATFKQADKNADGKLSREEAAALPAVADKYDKVDANADGSVSADEFAKAMKM